MGRVEDSDAAITDCVVALNGKYNNPESSKVASRYDSQLQLSIITIGTWLDNQIGLLWERATCANSIQFHQTHANERIWMCAHMMAYEEGF